MSADHDGPHASSAAARPRADRHLRPVTCTGDFDRQQRSYRGNLVVSADRVL